LNILTYNVCQKPLISELLKDHLNKFDGIIAIDFSDKKSFYKQFKNVKFYDQVLLKYCDSTYSNKTPYVDLGFQKYFRKFEYLFHLILSRYDFDSNFNYMDRVAYYRELSSICFGVIKKNNINEIIFYDYPHHADSFLLYHICKFLKLKINIISYLYILKNYRIVFDNSYEERFVNFRNNKKLDSVNREHILELIKKYKISKKHIRPEYIDYKKYNNFISSNSLVYLFLKDLYRSFRRGIFARSNYVINLSLKKQFIDQNAPNEIRSVILTLLGRLKILKLKKIYKKISVKPNFKYKYVLFCPNVQPEASTLPLANNFVDFINLTNLLIKYLPSDWKIFYKEHPLTFSLVKEAYLAKDKNYFKNFISNKIIFIDYNYDIYELIKNSQFVVTPTGSVGIESIIKSKVVLNFGNAWWRNYENVSNITDEKELEEVILDILDNKIHVNQNTLERDIIDTFEKTIDFPYYYIENEKDHVLKKFYKTKIWKELQTKFNESLNF
jgi:hypothetical protein